MFLLFCDLRVDPLCKTLKAYMVALHGTRFHKYGDEGFRNTIQSLTCWFVLCFKQALGAQCGGCPYEKLWPCPSAWKPKIIQSYHQELPQIRWAPFTEEGASQSRAMSGVSSVAWWYKKHKRSLRLVSHERVEFKGIADSQFWRALHWCSSYPHTRYTRSASITCIQTSEYIVNLS